MGSQIPSTTSNYVVQNIPNSVLEKITAHGVSTAQHMVPVSASSPVQECPTFQDPATQSTSTLRTAAERQAVNTTGPVLEVKPVQDEYKQPQLERKPALKIKI